MKVMKAMNGMKAAKDLPAKAMKGMKARKSAIRQPLEPSEKVVAAVAERKRARRQIPTPTTSNSRVNDGRSSATTTMRATKAIKAMKVMKEATKAMKKS